MMTWHPLGSNIMVRTSHLWAFTHAPEAQTPLDLLSFHVRNRLSPRSFWREGGECLNLYLPGDLPLLVGVPKALQVPPLMSWVFLGTPRLAGVVQLEVSGTQSSMGQTSFR